MDNKQWHKLFRENKLNEIKHRPIYQIAAEIEKDWKPVHPWARYLTAMYSLNSINDNYIMDSGSSIVAYFLSNARTWKGDTARKIKKELNDMLK